MTLIQGFRLEDIVLQIEMNTQLRVRINRNAVNPPSSPMLMCNICNTDDEVLSLSLCLSFSYFVFLALPLCLHLRVSACCRLMFSSLTAIYKATAAVQSEKCTHE